MTTPQPPIDPANPLGAPVPAGTPDPLTADHVPQHALGEPPGQLWPEATLAPPGDVAADREVVLADAASARDVVLDAAASARDVVRADRDVVLDAAASARDVVLAEAAADLTAHVGQLAAALAAERTAREEALAAEAEARTQDRRTVFTWLRRGGGFVAFDVVVTVAGLVAGFLLYGVVGTVQKQQTQTCFLYQLIVNNYDPAGIPRRNFKSGTLAYDQAYQGMYNGAISLNCPGIKRPAFPVPFGAPVAAPVVVPVVPIAPPTVAPTPLPTPRRVR